VFRMVVASCSTRHYDRSSRLQPDLRRWDFPPLAAGAFEASVRALAGEGVARAGRAAGAGDWWAALMGSGSRLRALTRYAWVGGLVYAVALIAETVISVGFKVDQNDSAAKIATSLDVHHTRVVVVFCISILYIVGFVFWLTRLDDLLRRASGDRRFYASWVLISGVLFVTLYGTSDVGIVGVLATKVGSYSAQHEPGVSYMLYLLTFTIE
jgi:hypothetical protein